MAGPWEKYAKEKAPWEKYASQGSSEPVAPDKAPPPPTEQPQSGGMLQKADDLVRMAADGLTGGYADKFAAYMGGSPLEQERAKTDEAAKRLGWVGTAAQIAGTAAGPGKVASGAAKLIPRVAPILTSALTGAGIGGFDAAGHDQNIATGAGVGALAGVGGDLAAKGISGAVGKVAGAFNKTPPVVGGDELEALKNAAYGRAESAGGVVNSSATSRLADALRNEAAAFGYDPAMQPSTAGLFNRLKDYEGQNLTMKGLDTLRKIAGRTWESRRDSDTALGSRLKSQIDDFADNLTPSDMIPGMGDATAANAAFKEARNLANRSFKNDDIMNAVEYARERAASTGTGGNVENAIRQELRKLKNSNTSWTPDELQALSGEINPGLMRNTLRSVGGLSPDKGVIPLMANMAAIGVNPMALAGSLMSMGARHGSEYLQKKGVEDIGRLVRSGGSKSAITPAPNAVQRLAKSKQDALARALMSGAVVMAPESAAQP